MSYTHPGKLGAAKHLAARSGGRIRWPALVAWSLALGAATVACSVPPATPTAKTGSTAVDCSRFEDAIRTPNRALAPGERFRTDWRFTNCGRSDWRGYRAVRIEGNFGPEAISIQGWAPGTTGTIWLEAAGPTAPGRYRLTYQLQGTRGPFGTFWAEIAVESQQQPQQP